MSGLTIPIKVHKMSNSQYHAYHTLNAYSFDEAVKRLETTLFKAKKFLDFMKTNDIYYRNEGK